MYGGRLAVDAADYISDSKRCRCQAAGCDAGDTRQMGGLACQRTTETSARILLGHLNLDDTWVLAGEDLLLDGGSCGLRVAAVRCDQLLKLVAPEARPSRVQAVETALLASRVRHLSRPTLKEPATDEHHIAP